MNSFRSVLSPALLMLFGFVSCAGTDQSFSSITNIPPPPAGKSQVIVLCSPLRWVHGNVTLDDTDQRSLNDELFVFFDTHPGTHTLHIDLGPGEAELESGAIVLGDAQALYVAIMRGSTFDRKWTSSGLETLGSVSTPGGGQILLVTMNREQAQRFNEERSF